LYDAVAMLAVLNFVALGSVMGYLTATGTLNSERVRKAVTAFRGNAVAVLPVQQAESPKSSVVDAPVRRPFSEEAADIMQREAERLKTEIDQRVALANSIMLKVKTEREAFRREQDAAAKQQEADRAKQLDEGFQKQLEILTSLAPKTALGHLLALNDPDKAALMLTAMDTDRVKKIVESAKRGEDLTKMQLILQRMQTVKPAGRELQATASEEP
jgi:hypothetical protein